MIKFLDKILTYTVKALKYGSIALATSLWLLLLIAIIYHVVKFIGTLI